MEVQLILALALCSLYCASGADVRQVAVTRTTEKRVLVTGSSLWGACSKTCGVGVMTRTNGGRLQSVQCAFHSCQCKICCEMDLVFVVDRSGSMYGEWNMVKQFMRDTIACLTFGPNPFGVRVGIVYFNHAASVKIQLRQGLTKSQVLFAINSLPTPSGGTNVAAGLNLLPGMFTVLNGDRCKVCNVAIVISDGYTVTTGLQAAIDNLKKPPYFNMKIFGIAIGTSSVNAAQVQSIASDPDSYYFYHVQYSFQILSKAQQVAKRACKACDHCPR